MPSDEQAARWIGVRSTRSTVLAGLDAAAQQAFIADLVDRLGAEPAGATTG